MERLIAQLAAEEARIAADPMRKYDTYGIAYDGDLAQFLTHSTRTKTKPATRRGAGQWAGLASLL